MPERLTRADLVKAFSGPAIPRQQTMEIVAQYMGNSPVPPAWSYAGVRGTFGKKAARMWAKKLRHRMPGVYRDPKSGRWLHPVVQSVYDFGTTPEKLRSMADMLKAAPVDAPKSLVVFDEYHKL